MELDTITDVSAIFSSFYKEVEENSCWKGHSVKISEHVPKKLSEIFEKNRTPLHFKQPIKPLMGCTREAKVESEIGFSQRDGAYGKVTVTWEFDRGKSDTEGESDKTNKGAGEVNSPDKDDH